MRWLLLGSARMRRVIEEFMNWIVFAAIAAGVGLTWFLVLSWAVNGHVKW